MGKATSTALATLDDYESRGGYIVLHPVVLQTQGGGVSPVLVESVSVVRINPAVQSGEVYHDFRYAPEREGKAALTALGLAKIAAAAGIQWDAHLCRILERVRRADGHVYIAYQAAGRVRQVNGEYHTEIASADMDTADEAEDIAETYRRKVRAGRAKYGEDAIPDMVRREILQLRKFSLRHVETKAKNRVIRRLLSLHQVYSVQQLQQTPFVVPRLLVRPEVLELEAKAARGDGRRAEEQLYGPSSPLSEDAVSGATRREVGTPPPDPSVPEGEEARADGTRSGASSGTGAAPAATASSSPGEGERKREAAGADAPLEPREDPIIEDAGPWKHERMSYVAEKDPGYLRGVAASGRTKRLRELAREWLDYYSPPLGGGS